jgi:hypothetical protein
MDTNETRLLTSAITGLKNYSSSAVSETSINAYQTILRYSPSDGDYYWMRYPCYDQPNIVGVTHTNQWHTVVHIFQHLVTKESDTSLFYSNSKVWHESSSGVATLFHFDLVFQYTSSAPIFLQCTAYETVALKYWHVFMLCTEMRNDKTTENESYTAKKLAAGVEYTYIEQ